MKTVEFYIVKDDGEIDEVEEFGAESTQVYIAVDHDSRNIFLWKGLEAGVRLKFIGSRSMGEKRKEVGYHYTIHVTDQDDELNAFRETIARATGEEYDPGSKALHVDSEAPPDLEAMAREQGIDVDSIDYDDELLDTPVSGMGAAGNRPQRTLLSELDRLESEDEEEVPGKKKKPAKKKAPAKKAAPKKEEKPVQTAESYRAKIVDEAKKLLKELGRPQGYTREMVVINETLYRIGEEPDDLEKFESPLEGIFNVNEFTPRLICQSDRVILIELLKPTGEELDEELTQNLSDLTAMFMIEIE